jgi:uncharacterized membrane protein (UPF0127 family)
MRFIFIAFLLALYSCQKQAEYKQANITISNVLVVLDVAETNATIKRGLKNKESLCTKCGMLFDWHKSRYVKFWMKDTHIPLDIAYINEDLMITEIIAMQPLDENSIKSKYKARYAIEMNNGWFASNGIQIGDKVTIEIF